MAVDEKIKKEILEFRKNAYFRLKVGETTITAGDAIHVPAQVIENYRLKPGDVFQWFIGSFEVDFPEELLSNMMVIVIKRKSEEELKRKAQASETQRSGVMID